MPWFKQYCEGSSQYIEAVQTDLEALFPAQDYSSEMLLVQQVHGPGRVTFWLRHPINVASGVFEDFEPVEDAALPKNAQLLAGDPQHFERVFLQHG